MAMDHVTTLECTICEKEYDPDQIIYTCPEHEGVKGILEVKYDYDVIDDNFDADLDGNIQSQWKYEAFLPVDDDAEVVTLNEGGTDLFDAPNLSEELGVETLVKDDGRNPTGCFKDRASSIAVTKAKHAGRDIITCASTGNAAASLSGYAARGGLDCRIFVPGAAPAGKLAQPLVYGADVLAVNGSYDEAYDLSVEVTDEYGWYNRNAAINPFQVEGKRTVGHELAEQSVVRGEVPDWVVFSMGDGCTIAGAWKGFKEFTTSATSTTTRRCSACRRKAPRRSTMRSRATKISTISQTPSPIASPSAGRATRSRPAALPRRAAETPCWSPTRRFSRPRSSSGARGIYAEPAGATPVAGVQEALEQGIIERDETVVVVSTGFGLKDTESAKKATGDVNRIEPELSEVEALFGDAQAAAADD